MNISFATANFYNLPFIQALQIIKAAGFDFIELDLFWQGGDNWQIAQHLKGMQPREVLQMIKDCGLQISSLHDAGGVIEDGKPSFISPDTYRYLECGIDLLPCLVLHVPHRKTDDKGWWSQYNHVAARDLQTVKHSVLTCIENMTPFAGYQVPLLQPHELLEFTEDNGVYINIDTTHCAECGIDLIDAADILKDRVKAVHLSDHGNGRRHAFPGEGTLAFGDFFERLPLHNMHAITLECSVPNDTVNFEYIVDKVKRAKQYIEQILTSSEVPLHAV